MKSFDIHVPSGYKVFYETRFVKFLFMDLNEPVTVVDASLTINNDLTFQIHLRNCLVKGDRVSHITKKETISFISEVANLLACIKSWITDSSSKFSKEALIHISANIIQSTLRDGEENDHDELLTFIVEQLLLCFKKSSAKHYSPKLIINSFLWHMTAPKLYNKLRDVFILPTDRRLRQLSSNCSVELGNIDLRYLRRRLSCMPKERKYCLLIMDEINTAQRIEYSNGNFYGITDDGEQAKTVLAFSLQFVSCKFHDVVMIVPIKTLTVDILKN